MSITDRWIIGILISALSMAAGIVMQDMRMRVQEHDTKINVNTSRLSVVETETRDQWKAIYELKQDQQRQMDDLKEAIGEHRRATEKR